MEGLLAAVGTSMNEVALSTSNLSPENPGTSTATSPRLGADSTEDLNTQI